MPVSFLDWTEEMSVGVAALDAEHKRLFAMFRELHDATRNDHGPEAIDRTIKGLVVYTLTHFKHEEELFEKTNYPDAAAHRKEHEDLARRVHDLQALSRFGPSEELARETFGFLQNWLASHINGTDKKYTAHLNANGIR